MTKNFFECKIIYFIASGHRTMEPNPKILEKIKNKKNSLGYE